MKTIYSWILFLLWIITRFVIALAQLDVSSFHTSGRLKELLLPWSMIGFLTIIFAIVLELKRNNKILILFFRSLLAADTLFFLAFMFFLIVGQPIYYIFILFGVILFLIVPLLFLYDGLKAKYTK